MHAWNTKRHQCLDLTATEPMLDMRSRSKIQRFFEWIQEQMLRRGILLTEKEQTLGYSERIRETAWKGSHISNAAIPYIPMRPRSIETYHSDQEIEQPIQPRLKTTSAYWPLEVKTYLDEQVAS